MKIASSAVSMAASHSSTTVDRQSVRLQVDKPEQSTSTAQMDIVQLTLQASKKALSSYSTSNDLPTGLDQKDYEKIKLLEKMLEMLTGKKVHFLTPDELNGTGAHTGTPVSLPAGPSATLQVRQLHAEHEVMNFGASVQVRTADGRSINAEISLNMQRSYVSASALNVTIGRKKDPLILNLNDNLPTLTEKKYSFDIDVDGTPESISFLGEGSGFLALDKNSDGKINDGSELFGATSGDGFADLAQYDGDGNGWIDENDAVFDRLSVWTKDANGNDHLLALGQANVGAIYLGSVATHFDINTSSNQNLGTLRSSGIFLKESGEAGTIQHLDLAI